MPSGTCAWRKRNDRTAKARRRLSRDHRILEHDPGEGLGGASPRIACPGANDSSFYWHDCALLLVTAASRLPEIKGRAGAKQPLVRLAGGGQWRHWLPGGPSPPPGGPGTRGR